MYYRHIGISAYQVIALQRLVMDGTSNNDIGRK